MGRKEDEENQSKVSKSIDGSIEELSKKCKPLNIQLNRLELPTNGVVLIKDNDLSKLNYQKIRNKGESSDSAIGNEVKVQSDDYTNDTAETIKKIKEFIALGRSEDSKKDSDSSDKNIEFKCKPPAKRKIVTKNGGKTPIKKLCRKTLSSEKDLKNPSNPAIKFDENHECNVLNNEKSKKNKYTGKNQQAGGEVSKNCDYHHESSNKNNEFITPSRVSKRIQSNSVKFSVKKMLRGDDANVLRRIIPGYEGKPLPKKDRSTEKKVKTDIKVKTDFTPVKPPALQVSTSSQQAASPEKDVQSSSSPTPQSFSEPSPNGKEEIVTPPELTVETLIENKEKIETLSDKISKSEVGNGKLTVELKGPQQRKVVRLAIPPANSQSTLPKTSLGPDITIKRVKPVKKAVVMTDDDSSSTKGITEKDLSIKQTPTNSKVSRPNLEDISPWKLKENLEKIQKSLYRKSRSDKKNINSGGVNKSPVFTPSERLNLDSDVILIDDEPIISNTNHTVDQSEFKKLHNAEKTRGRKTAKVTPLTQAKINSDDMHKKTLSKKPDIISYKLSNCNEIESEKKTYDNYFDRFFSTTERYAEHHDSLESESDEDLDDKIYAHFINIKKNNEVINKEQTKDETLTMYDLMHDIAMELPTWNIHVVSDGLGFCLAQVDIENSVPSMKKVIEVDLDYNIKVFVRGNSLTEYDGRYSSYDDIRELIYNVDRL